MGMFDWFRRRPSEPSVTQQRVDIAALRLELKELQDQFPELVTADFTTLVNRNAQGLGDFSDETTEMRALYRKYLQCEPTVKSALVGKVAAVVSNRLSASPQNDEDVSERAEADFINAAFNSVEGGISIAITHWLIAGLTDGWSISEKVWAIGEQGLLKGRWYVKALKSKDTDNLRPLTDTYRNLVGIESTKDGGQVFDPSAFLRFSYLPLFESPTGTSDLRAAVSYVQFKHQAIKLRMIYLDKFKGPFIHGEWADKNDKSLLATALEKARASGVIVTRAGTKVNILDLATGGTSDFKAAIEDLDKQIVVSVHGAFLHMLEGNNKDARGSSGVQERTTKGFQWLLAEYALNAIRRDLVADMIRFNFGAERPVPMVDFEAINPEEVLKNLQIDQLLQTMGAELSKKQVYRNSGRTPPVDDADRLVPPAPPMMPGKLPTAPGGGGNVPFSDGPKPALFTDRDNDGKFAPKGTGDQTGGPDEKGPKADPKPASDAAPKQRTYPRFSKTKDSIDELRGGTGGLSGFADRIESSLNKIESAGFTVPDVKYEVDLKAMQAQHGKNWKTIPATAESGEGGTRRVLLNPLHALQNDPEEYAKKNGESGYASTSDKDHVLIHEMGHVSHMQGKLGSTQEDFASPFAKEPEKAIAKKVSKRAAESPAEFVAETFAGIVGGKKYDADVMSLYAKFEGPGPKPKPAKHSEQPKAGSEIALAGKDGKAAAGLMQRCIDEGKAALELVTRSVAERSLNNGVAQPFTAEERKLIQDTLASTLATSELLGRSRVRERATKAEAAGGLFKLSEEIPFSTFAETPLFGGFEPLPPVQAANYFNNLIPTLNVDPRELAAAVERQAFTLSAATEDVILRRVQDSLGSNLIGGGRSGGFQAVQSILDSAGVSPANPQYAEMVYRTNMMDAYNVGHQREMQTPDMQDMFPVWQYLGIDDGRQGSDHAPKFNRYYPSSASFAEVRGPRPFNCRCTANPIDKYTWEEDLKPAGARLETSW